MTQDMYDALTDELIRLNSALGLQPNDTTASVSATINDGKVTVYLCGQLPLFEVRITEWQQARDALAMAHRLLHVREEQEYGTFAGREEGHSTSNGENTGAGQHAISAVVRRS